MISYDYLCQKMSDLAAKFRIRMFNDNKAKIIDAVNKNNSHECWSVIRHMKEDDIRTIFTENNGKLLIKAYFQRGHGELAYYQGKYYVKPIVQFAMKGSSLFDTVVFFAKSLGEYFLLNHTDLVHEEIETFGDYDLFVRLVHSEIRLEPRIINILQSCKLTAQTTVCKNPDCSQTLASYQRKKIVEYIDLLFYMKHM